jgi:hypothetical protein
LLFQLINYAQRSYLFYKYNAVYTEGNSVLFYNQS